jgi:hypothetical protein
VTCATGRNAYLAVRLSTDDNLSCPTCRHCGVRCPHGLNRSPLLIWETCKPDPSAGHCSAGNLPCLCPVACCASIPRYRSHSHHNYTTPHKSHSRHATTIASSHPDAGYSSASKPAWGLLARHHQAIPACTSRTGTPAPLAYQQRSSQQPSYRRAEHHQAIPKSLRCAATRIINSQHR